MKILTPLCLCISLLLSFNSFAIDVEATFAELDKDNNGTLSEAEASEDAVLHESFEQIDKDQNGQISFAEFKQFLQ
ncbi:EF-hand domain-containing protein [Pseudoalteromonas rhizosphaerae]|uniref:EF-hand domain-containing protein n=1 Tax=Pseudoalteromonas rhizosphaerae TaxID=2518973 RepID=A0ABW8L391_9GAMM|nr:EF-hand domain-containing protein [Pseudoalteromonas rhizosphaerae]